MAAPYTNHLIHEKSPYLLQHAHNPVDWYPWGQEAFDLAKELDKPIFLSIGYATCHWCHVMAHESFENADVAKMMNESFVNIKVDREERPEVDDIYMEFAQALMSTSAGWPLNVVLTPDLKPFFAVTYLPPKTKRGMIGLDQFIMQIKQLWQSDDRPLVLEQANKIVEIFERSAHPIGDALPLAELVEMAAMQIFEAADPSYGGLKGEPKFPLSYHLQFLMELAQQKSEGRALFLTELTLDKMANGGLYDHLGGGFSRYTVDERWQIPHFEKMLYDNALLAQAYLEGWLLLKKPRYSAIVKEILDYVLRTMTGPEGEFYAAEDADTEGDEGRFYTWTLGEIKEVLPPDLSDLFCQFYGVTERGNFEGRNVLHIDVPLEEFAIRRNLSEVECDKRLSQARQLLVEKRNTRPHPFKDDKVLTGWNGLMIATLADAAHAFGNNQYAEAAVKAAKFIHTHLVQDGFLLRRYRDGDARFHGVIEDYAFLIKALLTLHERGYDQDREWLNWAISLTALVKKAFKVPNGAFFMTDGREALVLRKCGFYDGPMPSGNAVHAENLIRLSRLVQDVNASTDYLTQAEDVLRATKNFIETFPVGSCYHLRVLLNYSRGSP